MLPRVGETWPHWPSPCASAPPNQTLGKVVGCLIHLEASVLQRSSMNAGRPLRSRFEESRKASYCPKAPAALLLACPSSPPCSVHEMRETRSNEAHSLLLCAELNHRLIAWWSAKAKTKTQNGSNCNEMCFRSPRSRLGEQ